MQGTRFRACSVLHGDAEDVEDTGCRDKIQDTGCRRGKYKMDSGIPRHRHRVKGDMRDKMQNARYNVF
jgi:hypothetical protein